MVTMPIWLRHLQAQRGSGRGLRPQAVDVGYKLIDTALMGEARRNGSRQSPKDKSTFVITNSGAVFMDTPRRRSASTNP